MSQIIIVRVEDVPKTPKAFQRYVADWFAPMLLLGHDCMWVTGRLHVRFEDYAMRGRKPGFAPSHSVDTHEYREGLPEGMSLGDWIRKNQGTLVWSIYAREDTHSECVVDDD